MLIGHEVADDAPPDPLDALAHAEPLLHRTLTGMERGLGARPARQRRLRRR